MKKAVCLVALFAAFAPTCSVAWNKSEIEWLSISTEHFRVQYHPGLERYAAEAAALAELIYAPITSFYRYEPDGPIYINISDTEDESNGATYYYLNRIDIDAAPYDFWFRGSASWLYDVLTHEFTHMVSIQSSFKFPRRIPAIYLQAIGFEKEKRPDVIYGYPNLQVSVPVPGELLPNWFAEGTAQYQSAGARHDIWDSHRDMMLRTAFLSDRLLTLDEMGVFGKTSRGSEMVYNQGFSLVRFIAERFGEEKIRELAAAFKSMRAWGFSGPCARVLGLSEDELYRLWKEDLAARYRPVAASVRERELEGERAAGEGFMNLFPVSGSDPDDFYYLSNRGRDYIDLDIVHRSRDGTVNRVVSNVSSRFSIAPDGTRICFSRKTRSNDRGYLRNDLHIYSIDTRKEKRLTRGLRAANPAWSPDGARIACVITANGGQRVALVDAGTGTHTIVTPPVSGREYTGLSWGTGGLLAARFDGSSRDVVRIDPETGTEEMIIGTDADERDPCWNADGSGFFYACDRTGIFNVYYHEMGVETDLMVTNCIGGAFAPEVAGDGILYSGYGADGFEIRHLGRWRERSVPGDARLDDARLINERLGIALNPSALQVGQPEAGKKFGMEYTKLFLYPRLMMFHGRPRIGLFLDSGDFLGRQSVFAGGTIGANGEFDLNLMVETRQFKPTFGFEMYRSRTRYEYQSLLDGSNFNFKVRYDLWDAYFTCAMEFMPTTQYGRKEAVLQYNHGEYGVNVELWELLKQREFRGEGGWNYYRADEISLLLHYRSIREEIDSDVNPRGGRSVDIEITGAFDKLHSGEFVPGLWRPIYDKDYFGRYLLEYEEYVRLPFWRHSLALGGKLGAIDKSSINDFFYLYLGGLDGLRGYSYYSMGGTRMALGRVTYRFPLVRDINRRVLWLTLGSLYAGAFAEAGKAWTEDTFDLNGNKKDIGFDLRLKGFTFYTFPIAASFEAAYGLNDVEYRDPFNTFATFYEGKEWKYYGSILFSF